MGRETVVSLYGQIFGRQHGPVVEALSSYNVNLMYVHAHTVKGLRLACNLWGL